MANPRLGSAVLKLSTEGLDSILDNLGAIRQGLNQTKDSAANVSQIDTFRLLADGATLAFDVVKRLTTEVIDLAKRGSELKGIKDSFDTLAASVGETGQQMLSVTRDATKGLITDIDLMASANKALLLGLPVSSNELGDLAKTATILGRAMKQDATKSLDDLIVALGRSSPMILDNLGLSVKLGEANEAMARKLGKSAEALTDAEKKTAFYEAAMEAARKKTAELGDIQLTLGDKIRQTEIWIQNQIDDLATQIAQSDVLATGFDSVSQSLAEAFGSNQAGNIETVVTMLEDAAIATAHLAELAIETGRQASFAFLGLRAVIFGLLEPLAKVGAVFIEVQLMMARAADIRGAPALLGPKNEIIRGLEDLKAQNAAITASFADTKNEALDTAAAIDRGADQARKALANMRAEMQAAQNAPEWQGPLQAPAARKDAEAAANAAQQLTEAQKKELAKREADFAKSVAAQRALFANLDLAAKQSAEAQAAAFEAAGIEQRIIFANLETAAQQSAEAQTESWEKEILRQQILFANLETEATENLEAIQREAQEAAGEGLRELASAIADVAEIAGDSRFGGFLRTIGELVGAMAVAGKARAEFDEGFDRIDDGAKEAAAGIVQMTTSVFALIGAMERATNTTSVWQGVLGGAATGAQFGGFWGAIGGAIFGGVRAFQKGREQWRAQRAAMEKEIADMNAQIAKLLKGTPDIGASFAALGLDFGATFDPDLEKRLENVRKFAAQLQERLAEVNQDFAPLLQSATELGERLDASVLLGLERLRELGILTEENAELLDRLEGAADFDWQKAEQAAERLGIRVSELGQRFSQAKLHDQAQQLINDFTFLTQTVGVDMGTALFESQKKFSEFVQNAIRSGGPLPENMRDWILELQRAGLLVDENGQAYTDAQIAALNWSARVQTDAERLNSTLEKLIETLGRLGDTMANLPGLPNLAPGTNPPNTTQPVPPPGGEDVGSRQTGSYGATGNYLEDFKNGQLMLLHGIETVATRAQIPQLAMDAIAGRIPGVPAVRMPTFHGPPVPSFDRSRDPVDVRVRVDQGDRNTTMPVGDRLIVQQLVTPDFRDPRDLADYGLRQLPDDIAVDRLGVWTKMRPMVESVARDVARDELSRAGVR